MGKVNEFVTKMKGGSIPDWKNMGRRESFMMFFRALAVGIAAVLTAKLTGSLYPYLTLVAVFPVIFISSFNLLSIYLWIYLGKQPESYEFELFRDDLTMFEYMEKSELARIRTLNLPDEEKLKMSIEVYDRYTHFRREREKPLTDKLICGAGKRLGYKPEPPDDNSRTKPGSRQRAKRTKEGTLNALDP
jgi:hypothetical protein